MPEQPPTAHAFLNAKGIILIRDGRTFPQEEAQAGAFTHGGIFLQGQVYVPACVWRVWAGGPRRAAPTSHPAARC